MAKRVKVSILTLLEQQVDLAKLLDSIPLREEALIEAALEQPSLVFEAGKYRVQKFHKRNMYETRLSLEKSKAGLRLRNIRDTKGTKAFTEGAVKERIELNPRVRKVRKVLQKAETEEEMGKLLQEVFRQRADSIRTIVNAGKVSLHSKELAILRSNKTLRRGVDKLRAAWDSNED